MNKRIKELLEQAGVKYVTMPNDTVYEKFAELIVRECADFARQHNLEKADRSHLIHRAIRQHFGEEE